MFQEADNGNEPPLPVTPHLEVETSPEKFHRYLFTHSTNLDEFASVQERLVRDYGSDPSAKDLSRVLRLPGFYHQKVNAKKGLTGDPFMVRIVSSSNKSCSWQEIKRLLPPVQASTRAGTVRSTRTVTVATAASLRSALHAIPAEEREVWVRVGLALSELGDVGKTLWIEWSQSAPEKYDPEDGERVWRSFESTDIGYETIFYLAAQHGWSHDSSGSGSPNDAQSDALVGYSLEEFLDLEVPPEEAILDPWLPKQGLAQIYAKRGVGKSYVAMQIALTVASGEDMFDTWTTHGVARKVLFIDGEMTAIEVQTRFRRLLGPKEGQKALQNLTIINPDVQHGAMPDLASIEGQVKLLPFTDEAELIIVDNISTLCRVGAENKADDWMNVQNWALRLRAEGKSVLFIHHAGKSGAQRGTSKREDVLNTVILLAHPPQYSAEEGATFAIVFEKARNVSGESAKPFVVSLHMMNEQMYWNVQTTDDSMV